LVADVGSTMTTVALIERVAGQHRFVARGESVSTHVVPWSNVLVGVLVGVRTLERLVGRTLLDDRRGLVCPRSASGGGVDGCVVVSSAAPSMRVALAGLTRDVSLACARQALAAAPVREVGCLALDDGIQWRDPNVWLAALRAIDPEIVVIVGGTDGGAAQPVLDLINLAALHNRMLAPGARPVVCYAGNAHLAPAAAQAFVGIGELRTIANVSPSLAVANCRPLTTVLDTLYRDRWLTRVPGMDQLAEWAAAPVAVAARSFGQLIRYVGERYRVNVIGLDLGSAGTMRAEGLGKVDNGHHRRTRGEGAALTRVDLGVGLTVPQTLAHIPLERIIRWLPDPPASDLARAALLNKGLYPQSVPQTRADVWLELALAREVMREVCARERPDEAAGSHWDLIIGAGRALTRAPHPAYTAMVCLDALQPVGVTKLAVDVSGVAGALGAVAARDPLAAAEVVEQDAFLTLGTLVSVSGAVVPGRPALRLVLRAADGRIHEDEILGGGMRVIPLASGQTASLELHPARGLDVGVGRPGVSATADVEGGRLGVVVDTRGRPLLLPELEGGRRRALEGWLETLLGGRGPLLAESLADQTMAGSACLS
jgi:hypothetical protein